jgi:hypothetical protein
MSKLRILVAGIFLLAGRPGLGQAHPSPAATDRSPEVVSWEATLDQGTTVKLMAPLGEATRITRPDGSVVVMIPMARLDEGAGIRIKVIDEGKAGHAKAAASADEIEVRPGGLSSSTVVRDLTLRVEESSARSSSQLLERMAPSNINLPSHAIQWELMLNDGREIRMVTLNGEMARVRGENGQWLGFGPSVKKDGTVKFRVFSIQAANGCETLRQLETFDVAPSTEFFPRTLSLGRLAVSGVHELAPSERGLALSAAFLGDEPAPTGCCVRCGATTACGCSVGMDCGDCCVPPCCHYTN